MEYNFSNKMDKLFDILKKHQIFKKDQLEAYIHALVDINESLNKIYLEYIDAIIANSDDKDIVIDNIWEIREEFRHISYHLNDAKLTE